MIRNYLITSFRNIFRHKITSIINVLCLSIAVGCSIIAYLFIDLQLDTERAHVNGNNIFVIEHKAVENGDLITFGGTPVPLGPALAADHGSVVRAVRINYAMGTVKMEAQQFDEWLTFADPGFFDMFTYPLESGDATALLQKDNIILSPGIARKYFGDANPIDKPLTIEIRSLDGKLTSERTYIVKGVTKESSSRGSSVDFSILLPFENSFAPTENPFSDWTKFTAATFIQVNNPADIAELATRMGPYIKLQQAADKSETPVKEFLFENLHDMRKNADNVRNSIAGQPAWAPIIVLSAISLFLLLLACFNFVNISLAMAGNRLKEIGIRKVIGGHRGQVVVQFITENVIICLVAFIVAVALTGSLLLPGFEQIAGTGIVLDLTGRLDLWIYLLALLIGVAIASGLYPALYISSFKPIAILRDKLTFGSKSRFMQSLLAIQFVLALITMMASVGLTLNYIDMTNRDWGYDKENLLVVQVANREEYNLVTKIAQEQSSVTTVSGANNHVGSYSGTRTVLVGESRTDNAVVFNVVPNYFETLGLQLAWGKLPESGDQVVLNEKFAGEFRMEPGKEYSVTIDSVTYAVTGVLKNFHHADFMSEIRPVVMKLAKDNEISSIVAKIAPGKSIQTRAAFESAWKKVYPDKPFQATFQDEMFEHMYMETNGIVKIFVFTTIVALLMSCVGLFGLASQRLRLRMKELCIRKIFGVPLPRAILLVNGNFLVLLTVAALIATPLSYFILNALLDSIYTYRMEVGPAAFIISFVMMFVTIAVTLSGKIYEIAVTNPAEILRNE